MNWTEQRWTKLGLFDLFILRDGGFVKVNSPFPRMCLGLYVLVFAIILYVMYVMCIVLVYLFMSVCGWSLLPYVCTQLSNLCLCLRLLI